MLSLTRPVDTDTLRVAGYAAALMLFVFSAMALAYLAGYLMAASDFAALFSRVPSDERNRRQTGE